MASELQNTSEAVQLNCQKTHQYQPWEHHSGAFLLTLMALSPVLGTSLGSKSAIARLLKGWAQCPFDNQYNRAIEQ